MPEEIVSRILRLPGYGVYAWEAEESAGILTLWIRQTGLDRYYVCGGCGISVRDVLRIPEESDRSFRTNLITRSGPS